MLGKAVFGRMLGCVNRQVNRGWLHNLCMQATTRNPAEFCFPTRDLFLTQKIEVGVAAGTHVDDGGKVPGKIVGVASGVFQRKNKRDR